MHWYANFKKKQAMPGPGGAISGDVELDELKDKFMLLQKHYVVL